MGAPHDISPALTGLFQAVLQASWQGSLAIVLVLLVRRVLGVRVPARWHHLLWFPVLARLLVPTVILPHSPASLENIRALAHPFERPPPVAKRETIAVDPGRASTLPLASPRFSVAGPVPRPVAMPLPRGKAWSPWTWAAWVWLGGFLLLAGWLAACVLRLNARLRRETFPAGENVLAIWRACCQRWLRHTPPRLLVADWVDSPALVGWWRPTLLIPRRSLDVFSSQDWEHVFAHEIAHLRWRDHWSQLLLLAAGCVHWFNPVVWLGLGRLRADRELAADEWVLGHLPDDERALAYGETLFKTLAHRPARLAFQPGMVGISEDGAQMKQRLRRIAAFLPRRRLFGSLAGLAVLLLLGTMVLGQGSPAVPTGANSPSSSLTARNDLAALEAAVSQGDASAARRLIVNGADVNGASSDQSTPLIEAVKKDQLEIAQLLLDHGARVDRPASSGRNDVPLAFVQSVPMAELLKKNGASLAKPRGRDLSLLLDAVRNGNPEVVTWFIGQGLNPKNFGADNENLLFRVAKARTAQVLLDAGVDPNQVDQFGRPALSYVRSAEVAQVLIERGAKVSGLKEPLLPRMVQSGSIDAMEVVLKAGADHDPGTLQQALIRAVGLDKEEVVRLLLKYGAKPNEPGIWTPDTGKELPLEVSCTFGSVKTARLLLEAGADPNGGKAPGELLKIAMRNGYKELAKLLRGAGARDVPDLAYAVAIRDEDKIRELLATAPAYAENPGFWDDALPGGARVGDLRVVRAALEHGVPIQPKYKNETVLDDNDDAFGAAAFEGQWEALAVLLAARPRGDDPAKLRLALWDAVMNCHPYKDQRPAADFERCVQMLIDAGAPVGPAKDGIGMVSVAVFTRHPGGNPNVIEMLVKAGDDPNPPRETDTNPNAHLLDAVREARAKGQCSAATADAIEKLNRLATMSGKAAATSPAAQPHFVNTGRVSMADGTPLGPDPITAHTHYNNGSGSGGGDELVRDGVFYLNFPHDTPEDKPTLAVAVEQRGCAVAFTRLFTFEDLTTLDHLEVKLTRGYRAPVQIVDERGRPIPGALLRPYHPGPPMVELAETRTDASGLAAIEHLGEAPLNLRVSADGFQSDELTTVRLDPAQPHRLALKPTQPLHGTVIAAASGKPIAGAVIKLGGVRGPHDEDHYDPKKAPVLTNADAQGHFALASLRPDSRYYLFVEAPGYGGAYVRGVTLAQGELNVTLGPELLIKGRIIHAPPSVIHMGKVYLQYGQAFDIGDNFAGQTGEDLNLQPINGEADFTVGPFYKVYGEPTDPKNTLPSSKQPIELYVDSWGTARFGIEQLPVSDFVFDLARKTNDRSPPEPDAVAKPADTEGNAASPSPTPANAAASTPTPKAKIIEIEATVSAEDGAPIGYHAAEIHPSVTFGPGGMQGYQVFPSFNFPEGTTTMRIPADARDVSFAVTNKGYAVAFAGPFSPPLEEKLKGLHFNLMKGFDATVQIVDEAGKPIAGARLQSGYSKPLYLDLDEITTDAKGGATLEHLAAAPLDLRVRADGYQGDEADGIRLDPAKPYRWTLKSAEPLIGSVTSAATGQPVAGAKIKLAAMRGPYNETHAHPPTAPLWATSDAQGRFALTSLRPDSRYFLFIEAPGHGGVLLRGIKSGQPELEVALGPERFVRGRFLHVPPGSINSYDGTFVFDLDQFFDIDGASWGVGQQHRVKPGHGASDFAVGSLYDNSAVILTEGREIKLDAKDLPKSGLAIDFASPPAGNDRPEEKPLPGSVTTGVGQKAR